LRRFAACAALLVLAAPCAAAEPAASGTLPGGTAYVLTPVSGPPVAAVELWFRAPAGGFGSEPIPSLSRLAAETVVSSKPLAATAKPLGSLVSDAGGRLNVSAYGDSLVVSALVPASSARDVVSGLTRAFFAPIVTPEGFKAAQRAIVTDVALAKFDPENVVHDAVFGALFSRGPHASPALGTPDGLAKITIEQVRAYADRAFRSQNAALVLSGNIEGSVLSAAAEGRPPADGTPPVPEGFPANVVAASPKPVTGSFPEPLAGFGWAGPPIADEREATALDFVADYLFAEKTGTVTRDLQASDPDTYVGLGQFVTLHDPGVFVVWIGGKNVAAGAAKAHAALAALQTPLDSETFARALAAFQFHMQSQVQNAPEVAENLGWYWVQGNLAYAPGGGGGGAYMDALHALTPGFVAKTVATYLSGDGVAVSFHPAEKGSR
jgi:hypothetical protein